MISRNVVGKSLYNDLQHIYAEYRQFLETCERYEPAWLGAAYIPDGRSYHIFYPQLLDDFQDYAAEFEEAQELHSTGEMDEPETFCLHEFDDYRQEFHHILKMIGLLIQQGLPPEQIAITLPDYDSLYPALPTWRTTLVFR